MSANPCETDTGQINKYYYIGYVGGSFWNFIPFRDSRERCGTSPSSSLRSMPPLLSGEALAFRRVFQQNQISFIENETSLPRAPLLGKTPPAGGGGTQVPKGERLASVSETERLDKGRLSSERNNAGAALYNLSVIFAHARCHLP